MIGIPSLLIWASTLICGVAATDDAPTEAAVSKRCYSDLTLNLPTSPSNEGWNGIGRGFLDIFTPAKLTDEHWEMIGKIYKDKDFSKIADLAMSMGGLIFLAVVGVLLMLCFCAAPISLCVFNCTCKKKCKPKSNAIIAYGGIGCASIAMVTIFFSILFCYLSIESVSGGIAGISTSISPLPARVVNTATKFKEELTGCVQKGLVSDLRESVEAIPKKMSEEISEIAKLKEVMAIDFDAKKKKIDEFRVKSEKFSKQLQDLTTNPDLTQVLSQVPRILVMLTDTKTEIDKVTYQLKEGGGKTMKEKLDEIGVMRKKASKEEIEKTIKEKIDLSSKISKVTEDVTSQIEEKFKKIEDVKSEVSSFTKEITSKIDENKDNFGYSKALNLILIPCYLALASAVWATSNAFKFVQKKKAKPKEKLALLIPLAVGLCLAFLPIIIATGFMMVAGVSNVACNTFFDENLEFLPRALSTFEKDPTIELNGFQLNIPKALHECKNKKTLIAAINGSQMISEDLVTKQFDINAKKAEISQKVNEMSFGLPTDADWAKITDEILKIKSSREAAKRKIDDLADRDKAPPPLTVPLTIHVPQVGVIHGELSAFIKEVEDFETQCKDDVGKAQGLKEDTMKGKIREMLGVGNTPTVGILEKMQAGMNAKYLAFRTELLETSTNCEFIFMLFKDVRTIVCDQVAGGFNGAYAAIGLGVMSFFSATVGTVMIWHSLRAGKEKKKAEEKGSDGSKGGKKKKDKKEKKSEGEGGEGEEEETSPAPPPNMAGKVGEQATPIGPPGSETNPAGGAQPPVIEVKVINQVQAVPTDPAAPGDKTNPSLLPIDVLPDAPPAADAGTPVSPVVMVPIETNQEDQPKSQTGPLQ